MHTNGKSYYIDTQTEKYYAKRTSLKETFRVKTKIYSSGDSLRGTSVSKLRVVA
jgi:hypothetical protein